MKLGVMTVACIAVALAGCRPSSKTAGPVEPMTEQKYPSAGFTIPSLNPDGDNITLSDFKGQVVLLDFWATWCPPCRAELPHLNKMYGELKDRGFSIVGMTVDQGSKEEVASLAAKFNLTYPVGLAGQEAQAAYGGIRAVPTKFLLDRDGAIRKNYVGLVPEAQLRADIEALLAN